MNKITRDLQIDLIMDNPNPIIDTFNGIWNSLSVIEVDVYHEEGGEFIYFNSNKEWVFFKDNKSDLFWCNYHRYWTFFETKFNLNNQEIEALTKLMVEEALNNSKATPMLLKHLELLKVEEALNNSKATPFLVTTPLIGE